MEVKCALVLVNVVTVLWWTSGLVQDATNKVVIQKHIPDLISHVCFVVVLTSSIVVKVQYVF